MDFNSESDQQLENAFDEENIERDYPTRQEAKRERDQRGYTQLFTARKKKQSVEDGKPGIFSLFKFLSSNKKKKVEMFWVKLVLKLFVVAAV
ncbi:hypothetical protein ABES02_28810, partial [Neobacillus pocheonensis]|uniref:hypothetical protein n=1 Tax=Neobacillus pocheonensis TaxID=363869 RepID=UPI003D26D42D